MRDFEIAAKPGDPPIMNCKMLLISWDIAVVIAGFENGKLAPIIKTALVGEVMAKPRSRSIG